MRGPNSSVRVDENGAPKTFADMLDDMQSDALLELNQHVSERLLRSSSAAEKARAIQNYEEYASRIESLYSNSGTTVLSFGDNDNGQLALPPESVNKIIETGVDLGPAQTAVGTCIRSVSAGGLHSAFVTDEGAVYTVGASDKGVLGHSGVGHKLGPVELYDGNRLINIMKCAAGSGHTVFLSTEGEIFQCGMFKDSDSLEVKYTPLTGIASEGYDARPLRVVLPGSVHDIEACDSVNAAILNDGRLLTWGMGNCGQLARSEGMTDKKNAQGEPDLTPVGFGYRRDDKSYDFPAIAECFLKPKEVIWASPFARRRVVAVSLGVSHIAASATGPDGYAQVYTSGNNSSGQLGHGDKAPRHQMTLVESMKPYHITLMAAGNDFTLVGAFGTNGVWSCGMGNDGELGRGLPTEHGQSETFQAVLFPEEIHLVQLQAAKKQSFALTRCEDYERTAGLDVWSWGYNVSRVLGHSNDTQHQSKMDDYEVFFRPLKLDLSGFRNDPKLVTRAFGLSAGDNHTLVRTRDFPKD